MAEFRQHSGQAEVVPIAETSWPQDRAKAWLVGGLTPLMRAFTVATTRCGGVARRIRGAVAPRVILSDRFPSSTWITVRQFCGAHRRPISRR